MPLGKNVRQWNDKSVYKGTQMSGRWLELPFPCTVPSTHCTLAVCWALWEACSCTLSTWGGQRLRQMSGDSSCCWLDQSAYHGEAADVEYCSFSQPVRTVSFTVLPSSSSQGDLLRKFKNSTPRWKLPSPQLCPIRRWLVSLPSLSPWDSHLLPNILTYSQHIKYFESDK